MKRYKFFVCTLFYCINVTNNSVLMRGGEVSDVYRLLLQALIIDKTAVLKALSVKYDDFLGVEASIGSLLFPFPKKKYSREHCCVLYPKSWDQNIRLIFTALLHTDQTITTTIYYFSFLERKLKCS